MRSPTPQQQRGTAADLGGVRLVALMLMPFVVLTAATLAARLERERIVAASMQGAGPEPLLASAIAPVIQPLAWPVVELPPPPPVVRTEVHAALPADPLPVARQPVTAKPASEARVCTPARMAEPLPYSVAQSLSAEAFGMRLARAARDQLDDFVIYSDRYVSIGYPMGDVLPVQGACTDVVIRAYRQLGIDLQELVHRARLGTGDRSIDHRRTETLRRLFARFGESLTPTTRGADFRPGDLVTYYRRHNAAPRSRSHIAIVSDVRGPSGNPMIIHNRGNGPELQDALFFDAITGHYRFRGAEASKIAERGGRSPHAGSRRGS